MKYFGHDSNAGDDTKLEMLVLEFGMHAYGIYWRCCEFIASKINEENQLCVLEQPVKLLAIRFRMPENEVIKILEFFVHVGLFDKTKTGQYRNLKLLNRLDRYTENRIRTMSKQSDNSVYIQGTHNRHKVDVKEKKRKETKLKEKVNLKSLQPAIKENTNKDKAGAVIHDRKSSNNPHSPLLTKI